MGSIFSATRYIRTSAGCETITATASPADFAQCRRRIELGVWNGRTSWPRLRVGWAMPQQADTEGLRRAIFSQAVFTRGAGQETASVRSDAVLGTTNRRTCVFRTGTGTTPTTGTTTSASVSPSPPARQVAGPGTGLFMDRPGEGAGRQRRRAPDATPSSCGTPPTRKTSRRS